MILSAVKPLYQITPNIVSLIADISEKLGEVRAAYLHRPVAELRKRNRIRTIHHSLSIEGNTLSIEQVTALMNGKRVAAPLKDITEVQHAITVYDRLNEFNPCSIECLLRAHGVLMNGLVASAGRLRTGGVGVVKGDELAHVAPAAAMVKPLLNDLFDYLKNEEEIYLIKSCVFHYEFEFIHPFADGNGRMGRLWQTLILREYNPVFEYLPIEMLIKKRQEEYYRVLGTADAKGDSTVFIEFMLTVINDSLEELLKSQNITLTGEERIELYKETTGTQEFTRSQYLRYFKDISTATASRDLKQGVENGVLIRKGTGRTTVYRFKK